MTVNELDVALHLDRTLPPDVDVRCEKGCLCMRAWRMPSGEVVVLVNRATKRISASWREQGGALADSPFIAMLADSDDAAQMGMVWADRPRIAVVVGCRHAQKMPLVVPAADVWDAAHAGMKLMEVTIPAVVRSTDTPVDRGLRFAQLLDDTTMPTAPRRDGMAVDSP